MMKSDVAKQSFDIYQVLAFIWRRKWIIVFSFIFIFTLVEIYTLKAPRMYRAQVVLSVVPQKVPSSYIKSTVSVDLEAYIHSLWQEITSRSNLEFLIKEYKLYPDLVKEFPMETVVERMRKSIKVSRPRGGRRNVFVISYEYTDPQKTAKVVNHIANFFIEENLRLREEQAKTVTAFLDEELKRIEKELREREKKIQEFKIKYMDELPEQKESIISTLDRLQKEAENIQIRKQMLEDRRLAILEQLKKAKSGEAIDTLPGAWSTAEKGKRGESASPDYSSASLEQLEKIYEMLLSKYTEKHPDVQRLKKIIEKKRQELLAKAETDNGNNVEIPEKNPEDLDVIAQFKLQLKAINNELRQLQKIYDRIQAQIKIYQARLENIPKREQELKDMTRDYQNLMETYRMLMNKKIQAAMSETLEKRQQGEQFRIIDPARTPEVPIKPDVPRLLLMGFFIAFAVGVGLSVLLEFVIDRKIYDSGLLERQFNIRVLATIPAVILPEERRKAFIKSLILSILAFSGLTLNVILLVLVLKESV